MFFILLRPAPSSKKYWLEDTVDWITGARVRTLKFEIFLKLWAEFKFWLDFECKSDHSVRALEEISQAAWVIGGAEHKILFSNLDCFQLPVAALRHSMHILKPNSKEILMIVMIATSCQYLSIKFTFSWNWTVVRVINADYKSKNIGFFYVKCLSGIGRWNPDEHCSVVSP